MRWVPALLVLVTLAACKRESQSSSARGSASPPRDANVVMNATDAAANQGTNAGASGPVDLLRAVPARVAVSSLVKNPDITPFDLVDGDMDTAWNSTTGELVGAWIAFRVPPAAHVTQIELTAGFVSSGTEGDYFTLNPRIKHVVVYRNGTKLLEHDLDITVRGMQSIPIGNEGGDYKIVVTAIEPGAKKNWRETCVSELRVIGSAPDMRPGSNFPALAIGSLDANPVEDPALYLSPGKSYASITDYCAELTAHPPSGYTIEKCGDKAYAPLDLPDPLPAGWKASWFSARRRDAVGMHDDLCHFAIEAKGRFYVQPLGSCSGPVRIQEVQPLRYEDSRSKAELVDVAGAPDKDLVMILTHYGMESLTMCVPTSTGAPACGEKQIAEMEHHNNSGGDQWDEWYEYKWKYTPVFGDSTLRLDDGGTGTSQPIRVLE